MRIVVIAIVPATVTVAIAALAIAVAFALVIVAVAVTVTAVIAVSTIVIVAGLAPIASMVSAAPLIGPLSSTIPSVVGQSRARDGCSRHERERDSQAC